MNAALELTNWTLPAETRIGTVALRVADLERAARFYCDVLGFDVVDREPGRAVLGAAEDPLVILLERPGIRPKPQNAAGLFHIAVLVPDRAALARAARRLVEAGVRLGASDHKVSEALYLADPDGNGIEVYRDRPPAQWTWRGAEVEMDTDRLDLRSLLAAAPADGAEPSTLPAGTRIGHMHLQVGDLEGARRFYVDLLGFAETSRRPGGLFMGAGGYHHHVAANTWASRGAGPAPRDAAGLERFDLVLPDGAALAALRTTIAASDMAVEPDGASAFVLADPWDNRIRVTV